MKDFRDEESSLSHDIVGGVDVSWGSHVGRVRQSNEDSVLVAHHENGALLLAVADGLGGQAAGEVASGLAVSILEEGFHQTQRPGDHLASLVEAAHMAILEKAAGDPSLRGMSTTCSALVIHDQKYWLAHVGDTRIYRVIDGQFNLLTQDHTWEASIQRSGSTTSYMPAAAKHVLTRCLGTRNSFSIDSGHAPLSEWDEGFLLCSDGLYGQVPEAICLQVWKRAGPKAAVARLIHEALESGAPDNISVIVAKKKV